ncbi:unnamed protein product, partial [Lymnaea stagnalis]
MQAASESNNSSSTESTPIYRGNSSLIPIVFLMSFLIIFGNTMTLLAIRKMTSLQTKSNAFVASLAVGDITVGLVLIPYGLWLVPDIRGEVDQSLFLCILMVSTASSAIVVSILNLMLVALDRLIFISYPFFYQRVVTSRVIAFSIAAPWTIGLLFGNTQWFIYAPKTSPPQCVITEILPTVYYKYAAPWFYFIPCVAVFMIYIKIALIARKQRRAITKLNTTSRINERNWRTVKMMMSVFGVFFVCWTPRFILYAFSGEYLNTHVPEIIFDLSLLLGLLNSGVNFLVYPLHNKEFRRAFKQILCF